MAEQWKQFARSQSVASAEFRTGLGRGEGVRSCKKSCRLCSCVSWINCMCTSAEAFLFRVDATMDRSTQMWLLTMSQHARPTGNTSSYLNQRLRATLEVNSRRRAAICAQFVFEFGRPVSRTSVPSMTSSGRGRHPVSTSGLAR